ncbi:MAG TPA: MFS transporter [Gaiellaceae bacterium]|nr:MFS transporter [Gaiellaceae bacterium]
MTAGVDKRAMAGLSTGHLATDFANGVVPALLPFLVLEFDLSYLQAGLVMLAWAISSSVVQPLFGLWSDRRGALWLLPAGLAAGGAGIGLAAAAPSYWLVLLLVTVSGLGTAAYHPEGSKFAAYVSGDRRASGMSLFSIGGNLGYALGPIAATAVILRFGLDAGVVLAVPPLVVAGVLLLMRPYLEGFAPHRRATRVGEGRNRPRALALLLAVIAVRNVAWFGLITFVPLYEVARGHSAAYGNKLLSLMLLAGGVGTLVAGPVADRIGRRPVLIGSIAVMGPLVLVYLLAGGLVGAAALALVGISVIGTFGVSMVMSQEYLPRNIGLASGLTIGLAIGVGGLAAVGLGALADAIELRNALYVCAAVPLAALLLGVRLPSSRARRPLAPEPVAP